MAARLSDIQLILLSTACQRDDGSLLPPADSQGAPAERIRKAIASLIKRDLAAEADVHDPVRGWREDGERHIGVFVTDAGREAAGSPPLITANAPPQEQHTTADAPALPPSGGREEAPAINAVAATLASMPRAGTKQALLVELLGSDAGASLADLATATDWLPHTTRAALTGLRKRGHAIISSKADGLTRYRIAGRS